jgi:predicted nucleic acid-binding Zn ribbon protein
VQSFTDDALSECPQCTGRLRKVFNSVGIVFKGSGFYRTDSRASASSSDGPKTEKSTAGGADSSSGSGSASGSTSASTGTSTGAGSTTSAGSAA